MSENHHSGHGDGVKTDHGNLQDHVKHFVFWQTLANNLADMLSNSGVIPPVVGAAVKAGVNEIDMLRHITDAASAAAQQAS